MQPSKLPYRRSTSAMVSAGVLSIGLCGAPGIAFAACAPCAPKGRKSTQANPCAAKNPCGAKNPCAAKNPCGPVNPCMAKAIKRPAGYVPYKGNSAELIATGKALFADPKLSTNGLSCGTCHQGNNAYLPTFTKPYPHAVAMAGEMGLKRVHADEMVQLCMVRPMAAKPFDWKSKELAALTAYVVEVQKSFKPTVAAANPCAAKNPCGAKNPCAAKNPCGAKNPCAAKKH